MHYFNKKYKRCGYLYQGRYKAVLVQSGTYLRRLIRYVHLNPVRAGIVEQPEDYRWSSHQAYIGKNVQNIVDAVCRHFNITLEDVCSAKRTKDLVLARMVMANLKKRLGAGSMTELAKQISRDPTSLAKLARKGELDVQVQNFTKTLLTSLTSEKYLSYA